MPEKNKKKTRYQILTIICIILAVIYIFAFYNAAKIHHTFNTYFYGGIAFAWLLLAWYWFKNAKKES